MVLAAPTSAVGRLQDAMAWLRPLTIRPTAAVAVPTDSTSLTTTMMPTGHAHRDDQPEDPAAGLCPGYSLVTNMYTGANRTGPRYPEGLVPLVEFTTATPLN